MKIKEIDRVANIAWSPAKNYPIYLAAGTAAQQLDSSFSTNSVLELYHFDVNQTGLDMPLRASLPCENRFHKVVWGTYGMGAEDKDKCKSGIIVGGCDGGIIEVYDANKILEGEENPMILTKNKHTGPVRALDFNSFRSYLIASGASDSEILIWDLNNPKTPMSPGAKPQPADDVTCLAWNKQVEHILASTFSSRCIVWDLRKNEPIIKVGDSTSRIRYKVVAWHPTVATQMCLASEDDENPVIQLWDLRYATAPLKVLQGHERGVLGLAWCEVDPELLLSCGKDNQIHCWNPNYVHPGYERVCDIQTSCRWSFDVSFCPRNPAVISTSSFDGRISVFGLSGGCQQPVTASKLADSFPGMDMDISHTPVPVQKPASVHLRDAPKWLKRPCGASFAFGGKLIHFANIKQAGGSGDLPDKRVVTVSQVVTLPDFIQRSQKLEAALESGAMAEFCQQKSLAAEDSSESQVWEFLQASFTPNSNEAFLSMLGYDSLEIHEKLKEVVAKNRTTSVDTITDGFVSLGRGGPDAFGAQLLPTENGTIFDTISQASTRSVTPEPEKLFPIPTDDDSTEGLLNQALLSGNLEYAVDMCLKDCRWADALILASTGGPELIKKAQFKYFHKCENEASNMVRAVVTRDLRRLVERCELDCWKQALATALTYADPAEFSYLAETLGRRLEASKNEKQRKCALLCYICCGNMNRLVDSWASNSSKSNSPEHLQDVVEQVMVLKKSADVQGKSVTAISPSLADKLVEYASLLVSQGCLQAALHYLADATEPSMVNLKERVYYSLGLARPTRSALQTRSRQVSESSAGGRHGLTHKRPSYPSAVQPTSPGISNNIYDSRRPSSYFDSPSNISSLTGPLIPAQSFDTGNSASFYNPLNVNVNQPAWPTAQPQHTPGIGHSSSGYVHQDVGSSLRNPSAGNSPGSLALQSHPPLQSWNDPPPVKTSTKPKTSTAQPLQPITHPIFGTAQPEQQSFPPSGGMGTGTTSYPYGGGDPYRAGAPSTGYMPPPASALPPPPPSSNIAPPPSTGFRRPPTSTYGHPPAAAYSQPPPAAVQPPPTAFGYQAPQPSSQFSSAQPPPSFGRPPSGAQSLTSQSTGGVDPYGTGAPSSGYMPPAAASALPPPPPASSNMSSLPSSGFRRLPTSTYGHPPAAAYSKPPVAAAQQSGGPPPSSFSHQAPPTGSLFTTAQPQPSLGRPPSVAQTLTPQSAGAVNQPQDTYVTGAPSSGFIPQQTSALPPPPPATSNNMAPPTSGFGAPPTSTHGHGHGPATAYSQPPTPATQQSAGPPPSSFGHQAPPTGSLFTTAQQQQQPPLGRTPSAARSSTPQSSGSGDPYGTEGHNTGYAPQASAMPPPPPSSNNTAPPSTSGFGGAPTSTYEPGPAAHSSSGFDGPPTSTYGQAPAAAHSSSGFGGPPTSTYGQAPAAEHSSSGFGGPPTSAFGQGPPAAHSSSGFGGPPTSTYGQTPAAAHSQAPPAAAQQSGGPPATSFGHQTPKTDSLLTTAQPQPPLGPPPSGARSVTPQSTGGSANPGGLPPPPPAAASNISYRRTTTTTSSASTSVLPPAMNFYQPQTNLGHSTTPFSAASLTPSQTSSVTTPNSSSSAFLPPSSSSSGPGNFTSSPSPSAGPPPTMSNFGGSSSGGYAASSHASAPPLTSFGPPFAPPSDSTFMTPVSLQDNYSSQI